MGKLLSMRKTDLLIEISSFVMSFVTAFVITDIHEILNRWCALKTDRRSGKKLHHLASQKYSPQVVGGVSAVRITGIVVLFFDTTVVIRVFVGLRK